MEEKITIEKHGRNAIVYSPNSVFAYEVTESTPEFDRTDSISPFLWTYNLNYYEGFKVLPYGNRNDLPQLLRDVVYDNPNIPGVMEKKQGLIWGKGPQLYREIINDKNEKVRIPVQSTEVENWLDSWDYQDYILDLITDFNFIQGGFTKFVQKRSFLTGKPFFNHLEHIEPHWARLAIKGDGAKPSHCIVSEYWRSGIANDYKAYPLFNNLEPFKYPNSVMYSRTKTFATDHYAIPTIFGALEWIRRSTAVPLILKALSKNSINAPYHVKSPQKFWDDKRTQLEEKARLENRDFDEKELDDFETELFRKINKTLSSPGRIWHTVDLVVDGMNLTKVGWEIKPIDQNIKDFVETQIKIADKADSAVSAALGIHKALGGITANGKADSGSEQLYAYLMFKLIGVDIPEYIIFKALNAAIKANFPNENVKIGFLHGEAQRQQDQTSQDRIKNN